MEELKVDQDTMQQLIVEGEATIQPGHKLPAEVTVVCDSSKIRCQAEALLDGEYRLVPFW